MNSKTAIPNIIIVDDVAENLHVLSKLLKEEGYKVRPYPGGELALEGVKSELADLILLDINMPGMNGYQVCERLKADVQFNDIPVIFISAMDETLDKVKAFNIGGVDYITKPFQIEEVLARVNTHLNLRSYQIEIEEKNKVLTKTLTELKDTQAQLIHSEKMASLGILAGGMAHEINNPINSIVGNSRLLAEPVADFKIFWDKLDTFNNADSKEVIAELMALKNDYGYEELFQNLEGILSAIISACDRAANIITGLRKFISLDKGEIEHVNPHECINSTLNILDYLIGEKIELVTEYGNIPIIKTSQRKLNQVIMNLITNAIDAINMKEKIGAEQIKVATLVEDKFCVIAISDTGSGMDDEVKKKIFDPFYTTKEIGKGTGLGLSISLGIMNSLGGKLTVESILGSGSTFKIYLPIN